MGSTHCQDGSEDNSFSLESSVIWQEAGGQFKMLILDSIDRDVRDLRFLGKWTERTEDRTGWIRMVIVVLGCLAHLWTVGKPRTIFCNVLCNYYLLVLLSIM